jgi:hypothetical protein
MTTTNINLSVDDSFRDMIEDWHGAERFAMTLEQRKCSVLWKRGPIDCPRHHVGLTSEQPGS